MSKKSSKVFILDTNVIFHDSTCLLQFKEHDIMIPLTVIEELDHFKRRLTIHILIRSQMDYHI
ncbi:MAG: PIN domain-containing protein [Ignavibacteria bacterium]